MAKQSSMLLKEIGADKRKHDLLYEVCEYQEGELIFGICNVYKHWNHHRLIKQQDVAKAYFYRIDPSKEEITILGQVRSCIGIAVSQTVVAYQKDDKIIQENVESGEKKIIYNIKNIYDLNIYVNGDYLLVAEWEKKLLFEKRNCYPVGWKDRK